MKNYRSLYYGIIVTHIICFILLSMSSCKKDNTDENISGTIPKWMQGEFVSQDSSLSLIIESDSIFTSGGTEYMAHCMQIVEKNDNMFQFISNNGCQHTFNKDGASIIYNLKLPGEPGIAHQEVGGEISFVIKAVLKVIKIIVHDVYGKNAPGLTASDERLYVLIKYSGTKYSVSSTAFRSDGSVSDSAVDWTTATDVVGPDGSGISYSNKGYIHLLKTGVDEVRSYFSSDIDQGIEGESHLATGVALSPFDPDTYGDYTYIIDGGKKKIYIGKFYPDHNKDKVDKVKIFRSGGSEFVDGICLSDDGKMLFATHTLDGDISHPHDNGFGLKSYQIDAANDKGAKNLVQLHSATKSHSKECWPLACDSDGSLLYVLVKDYDAAYRYFVAMYQMNLSDTDMDWIDLQDYLQADSDFIPSDIVVRGDYLYISNGKKDGTDGLKVLEIELQPKEVRNQIGAFGLNELREARSNGLNWKIMKQ